MESLNMNTSSWNLVYSEGRSLLVWPDEIVVRSLVLNKNKNFKKGIDIACGAGRHTLLMGQMGIKSVGIDASKASIDFARQRAKQLQLDEYVEFMLGEVQGLEVEKESMDVAIVWGLIHYLEIYEQEILLRKIWDMLKPGGMFLATFRSVNDSRLNYGRRIRANRYIIDYFKSETSVSKQLIMSFWSEDEVRGLLRDFSKINLGHRTIEPVGQLRHRTAHWLVEAFK